MKIRQREYDQDTGETRIVTYRRRARHSSETRDMQTAVTDLDTGMTETGFFEIVGSTPEEKRPRAEEVAR